MTRSGGPQLRKSGGPQRGNPAAGTSVTNTNLLTSITIAYSGTTVKHYSLTYQASPTTGRERLTQVQECSDSAGTNCLSPTAISYQNGTAGISTVASTFNMGNAATGWYLPHYDLNGDGYKDLVFQIGTTWYVAWGSATGYSAPVSTGINTPTYSAGHGQLLLGDVLGAGQDGLLANNGGTWYYYTWNGASFTAARTNVAYDTSAYAFALADTNGDGLPDLVSMNATAVYISLNNSAGSPSFSAANTAFTIPPISGMDVNNGQFVTPDSQAGGPLRRFDFNGDGRDDLQLSIQYYDISDKIHTHARYWLLGTGNTFTATATIDIPSSFVNWNNDTCTDWITGSTLTISACNGNPATTISLGYAPLTSMDWDGDGRTDLVYASGGYLYVQLSTGVGLGSTIDTNIPYNSSGFNYWGADINGDGLDDLEFFVNGSTLTLNSYFHNGGGQKPDIATSFADGYGNSAAPTYVSLVQNNYTPNALGSGTGGYYPYTKPLYVASQVVYSDPSSSTGATWNQQFWYYSGVENIAGRGFQGFAEMRTIDSRNNLYDYQYSLTSFPYSGMQYKEIVSQGASTNLRESMGTQAVTSLSTTADQQRYFPYFSNWTVQQWELGGSESGQLVTSTSTNYTFDNYGNATTVAATVTDEDAGSPYKGIAWTTTTTNTTDVDTTNWCLRLFTETQVAYTGGPSGSNSVTRTTSFPSPDTAHCRYTQIVTEPSSSQYMVTETLGYDSTAGTLLTDTITGVGMTARTITYQWDAESLFPTSVKDPSGAQTQVAYNYSFGLLGSLTDPNSSSQTPIVTSWQYDGFGRKTQESHPDGTYIKWSYNDCSNSGGCPISSHALEVSQTSYGADGSTLDDGSTWFDALERAVVVNRRMLTAGTYARNEVRYDSLGRVAQRAAPCTWSSVATSCLYWTTNSYDALNRLTQTQHPSSSFDSTPETTTYAYAGSTKTVTDPLGHARTLISDVTGALRQTKDANNYAVVFSYDAFGSRVSAKDSLGNTLLQSTYDYGLQPFQRTNTDIDAGARSFTYDALGELTSWSDAKGQSFSAKYDALSRMTDRYEPDLYSHWDFGTSASAHNIGKQIDACTGGGVNPTNCTAVPAYSESETYDGIARLSTRTIAIANDTVASYTYTWTYNAITGLLDTLTYPTPTGTSAAALKLQYSYSNNILSSIKDVPDNTVLWVATNQSPTGQISQDTLGNQVQRTWTYDTVTGIPHSVTAGLNGSTALQNQSYLFDGVGNITQRQENNLGLSENFYYDTVNRLSYSTLTNSSGTTTNLQVTYDVTGNILTRSDSYGGATWKYDPTHIHQVTALGGTYPATYDANGNMTERSYGGGITWTSYNYPSLINYKQGSSYAELATFAYDQNRNRYYQTYTNSSNQTETTFYVGKLLEKTLLTSGVTDWRHYVYAGQQPIAIVSKQTSGGTNSIHYVLEDHLGSTAAFLDSSGNATATESFNAYGYGRSATTWAAPVTGTVATTVTGISRRGFQFDTVIGSPGTTGAFGLVHMRGRVLDVANGRFLSPDPMTQDIGNTQDFNRYGYARNNPLTYVDPSGFDACFPTYGPFEDDGLGDDGLYYQGGGDGPDGGMYCIPTPPSITPLPGGAPSGAPPSNPSPPPPPPHPRVDTPPQGSQSAPQTQQQRNCDPVVASRGGIGCGPSQVALPPICFGTFNFDGQELDLVYADIFVGELVDSDVSGLDVGPLVEVSGGPEGVTAGGAFTHSILTGESSGFAFGGGKLSGGLLGGLQLGTIVGPSEIGAYFEGHSGFNARGTGFAFSRCP